MCISLCHDDNECSPAAGRPERTKGRTNEQKHCVCQIGKGREWCMGVKVKQKRGATDKEKGMTERTMDPDSSTIIRSFEMQSAAARYYWYLKATFNHRWSLLAEDGQEIPHLLTLLIYIRFPKMKTRIASRCSCSCCHMHPHPPTHTPPYPHANIYTHSTTY